MHELIIIKVSKAFFKHRSNDSFFSKCAITTLLITILNSCTSYLLLKDNCKPPMGDKLLRITKLNLISAPYAPILRLQELLWEQRRQGLISDTMLVLEVRSIPPITTTTQPSLSTISHPPFPHTHSTLLSTQ